MAKILVLAKSGFGKSTSLGEISELKIKGLDPKETYLISCVNKPLPFRGAAKKYVSTTFKEITKGNRLITKDAKEVAEAIRMIGQSPYKTIVVDDLNYISQDFYMKNAMKGGWDTPKQIGYGMGLIFDAIDDMPENKVIICMAHYEEYKDKNGDSISYRYKSTGNMVDQYICPEGKFEIVFFGKSSFNESEKKSIRQFVTNDDGQFPAKTPVGMFDSLYIPNDLGLIVEKAMAYYNGEE
jgi:hypothetical protein